jgi:hypothetical protein
VPSDKTLSPENVRIIKQSVLADVSCVLAKADGADIEGPRAFAAAHNICQILFDHPEARQEVPEMFWESPLGRAVGLCCGNRYEEPRVRTTLRLPLSVRERLRREAEARRKSLTDLIAEKLAK